VFYEVFVHGFPTFPAVLKYIPPSVAEKRCVLRGARPWMPHGTFILFRYATLFPRVFNYFVLIETFFHMFAGCSNVIFVVALLRNLFGLGQRWTVGRQVSSCVSGRSAGENPKTPTRLQQSKASIEM